MIERIVTLTKIQLTNKTKKHAKNSMRIYRDIALKVLMVILTTVILSFVIHLIKNVLFIPVNFYFLIFIILLTQLISIISATTGLTVDIYQSKDNQILFTFPVKADEIFISKLIVYYIYEYRKNFAFLIPFLISYGYMNNGDFWYYIDILPLSLILPFIVVFFSSILSVVFTLAKNFLSKYQGVSLILSVLLFIGFFALVFYISSFIPDNIRIVQLYNSFIAGLATFMQDVASVGSIYTVIGKLINGTNVIANYLLVIGTVLVLFAINYFVSRPLFFKLTSLTNEQTKTTEHNPREKRRKGLFWTFFRKETTIARRNPTEFLNNYLVLIFLPIVIYILNRIYMGIDTSTLGNQLVLIFNILIILVLITAGNTASAVSITTEGSEFILLKTAPSETKHIAWAKMAFNFIFTSIVLILSFIMFKITLPIFSGYQWFMLFIFVFTFNASQILWSFQLDILNPKLSDYASTGSISNNDNITKSLSNGLYASVTFTIISAIALIAFNPICWIIMNVIGFIWLLFRFLSFKTNLDAYFADIEY